MAQTLHFSFGAMGGVRLSRGAPGAMHDESPPYAVGPDFEVSVGDHLAVEFGGLYRRFGSSYVSVRPSGLAGLPTSILVTRTRADSLEFPVLGKYYFGHPNPRGRFFVATGYSFQRSWMTSTTAIIQAPSGTAVWDAGGPGTPTVVGAAFGAGVARKTGPLTIAPAFRYTRWGSRPDVASRNQIEILLNLRF